jgi:hypothetical protein
MVQLARGVGVVEERLNCIMRYRWAHPYPLVVKAYTYRVLLTRRYGASFGVGVHAADEVHRCVPFAVYLAFGSNVALGTLRGVAATSRPLRGSAT